MRQKTINGIEISYPNRSVFLGDSNIIALSSTMGNVGAEITIKDVASGNTKKHRYLSELNNITYDISDSFRQLYNDGLSFDVSVDLYLNGSLDGHLSFALDVSRGHTLPSRSHGSERTIYLYPCSDTNKLQLYFPASGTIRIGRSTYTARAGYNGIDISSEITDCGVYNLRYASSSRGAEVRIANVAPKTYDAKVYLDFSDISGTAPQDSKQDIWNDSKGSNSDFNIKIVNNCFCGNENMLFLKYYNCDGNIRYLGGRIIEQKNEVEREAFYRMETQPYRNIARSYLSGASSTVKLAFPGIARNAHIEDILRSDEIYFLNYNDEWMSCDIVSKDIVVKDYDTMDLELEICLNRY